MGNDGKTEVVTLARGTEIIAKAIDPHPWKMFLTNDDREDLAIRRIKSIDAARRVMEVLNLTDQEAKALAYDHGDFQVFLRDGDEEGQCAGAFGSPVSDARNEAVLYATQNAAGGDVEVMRVILSAFIPKKGW